MPGWTLRDTCSVYRAQGGASPRGGQPVIVLTHLLKTDVDNPGFSWTNPFVHDPCQQACPTATD